MSGASRGQNGIVVSRRRGKDTRQKTARCELPSRGGLERWFPTYPLSVLVAASGRSIFLTEGSTPRRGRRVLPVTMGQAPSQALSFFESAGTRAWPPCLDLPVGALLTLWHAERAVRAREKGFDQDR